MANDFKWVDMVQAQYYSNGRFPDIENMAEEPGHVSSRLHESESSAFNLRHWRVTLKLD